MIALCSLRLCVLRAKTFIHYELVIASLTFVVFVVSVVVKRGIRNLVLGVMTLAEMHQLNHP